MMEERERKRIQQLQKKTRNRRADAEEGGAERGV